jgi:lysozyme
VNLTALKEELIRDEGLRLKPYRDTVGKLTIGVGRNLDDVGITKDEAMHLLECDIRRVKDDLDHALSWWRGLDDVRQRVLVNMAFNLGITRLMGFKNTLAAMRAGNYVDAAKGMLDSKWAKQVGERATRLAAMMVEGDE